MRFEEGDKVIIKINGIDYLWEGEIVAPIITKGVEDPLKYLVTLYHQTNAQDLSIEKEHIKIDPQWYREKRLKKLLNKDGNI